MDVDGQAGGPGLKKGFYQVEGAPGPSQLGTGDGSQTADSAATNFNRLCWNGNSTSSTYDGNGKMITMIYDAFANFCRRPIAHRPAFRDRPE